MTFFGKVSTGNSISTWDEKVKHEFIQLSNETGVYNDHFTVPMVESHGPNDIVAGVQQTGRADEREGGAFGGVHEFGDAAIGSAGQHDNEEINVVGVDGIRRSPVEKPWSIQRLIQKFSTTDTWLRPQFLTHRCPC